MEQNPTGGLANELGVQKEVKKWADCTDTEKIEKLREEVMNHRYMSRSIGDLAIKIRRLFKHSHSDRTGEMVEKMDEYNYSGGECALSSRDILA